MEMESDIPEHHGLSSRALQDFFTRMEQSGLEINSFILLQDGKATAQFWRRPYRKDCPQLLYSLSKSFTSIAVGIARDQGFLDLNDKVVSFFPDQLPDSISSNLEQMTVRHLLSMTAGHHDNIYSQVAQEHDWVKAFLSLPVDHEPGTFYRYSTHSTYMLSAIVEKVAGQHLVDFLMPRLFEPLGIPRPSWETCPMGIAAGGMGLSLTTESIAAFGQMLLGKGIYKGRRIVSEEYIELATSEQSDNRAGVDRIDSAQGYGYQFHLCRRGCYRGDGAFGQLCFVAPNENIVIAATSSFKSMRPLQTLLDLIYEHIIEPLGSGSSDCSGDTMALQQYLAAKEYPVPEFQPIPDSVPDMNNQCYRMDENPHGLQKMIFTLKAEQLELHVFYENDRDHKLLFDFTKPVHTKDVFIKDLSMHLQEVVTYASWQDDNTLKLTMLYIETPYRVTYTIAMKERTIDFHFHINVSLTLSEFRVDGILSGTNTVAAQVP